MEQHGHEAPTVTVPLHDVQAGMRIYAPSIPKWVFAAGVLGALVLGWLGYLLASGALPVAGFGQWAAAGRGAATFAGMGVGFAIGGLIGGATAIARLPNDADETRSSEEGG